MATEARRQVVPHSQATAPTTALARPYFTSRKWLQRDRKIVIKRRWLSIGHASKLANVGNFLTCDLDRIIKDAKRKGNVLLATVEDFRAYIGGQHGLKIGAR